MLKRIIKRFFLSFFFLFRYYYRKKLIVLAYHDVKNEKYFESHLKFIASYYHPVSVQDVERHLNENYQLPRYAVLVTFDDGEPSLVQKGVPLLRKYGIPAVAFIISDNVRLKRKFWWKMIQDYYRHMGRSYLEARTEVSRLKKVQNMERMQTIEKIVKAFPAIAEDSEAITAADLYSMAQNNITIGSHTATHPILNHCTPEELNSELERSKIFFYDHGLTSFKYFAYPNGDYEQRLIPMLQHAGIELAFAFDHRINPKKIDRFCISRVRTNSHDSLHEFKLRLSGISTLFLKGA